MSPSLASSGASCASASMVPSLDVVESLYRDAPSRPGLLQPYEPSLRPPEGTVDFGWLFRPEQPDTSFGPLSERDDLAPGTGEQNLRVTTTSGFAAVLPAWPFASARRWPAAALLAVGLATALLLPWVVRAV